MNLPAEHPARRHALVARPGPASSASGLPLANGLLGALVWRRDGALIVSLDRTDVWDLFAVPEYAGAGYTNDALKALVDANDMAAIDARFEAPYRRPAPTKLPLGRISIALDVGAEAFALALDRAVVTVGDIASIAVDSASPTGMIRGTGPCPAFAVEAPAYGMPPDPAKTRSAISNGGPEDLAYDRPRLLSGDCLAGYVQTLPDGRAFCVRVEWRDGEGGEALWTVALAESDAAADAAAAQVLSAAWDVPQRERLARHRDWWAAQWNTAWLSIPDAAIERQWTLDAYKLIAAGRMGIPPIALQGPWTWDDGRLPPWKGDYHHDLNTQMTYWPTLTGNRLDAHRGFLDWLWDTRAQCRNWTRMFFGVGGLNVPMTADLLNRQIGGWTPYTHSASTGAWLAQHFVQHWRYTRDDAFLLERALPYLREVCTFIDEETRHQGGRRLKLSSSPEIGNNAREAWLGGWSNYDLALFRAALVDAASLCIELGQSGEAARWAAVLAELPDLALDETGGFAVAPELPLLASHRHFSHAMAIHPLRLAGPDDPRVAPTLARIEALGTSMWMGYSFGWIAAFHAYARDGEKGAANLRLFIRGFTAANSFHTNGDISGEQITAFPFEAFTLEGNCAAMAATQDMLLQSRSEEIVVFPAIPRGWTAVSFSGLRAEGDIVVDALREGDRVVISLLAGRDAACDVRVAGGKAQRFSLKAGERTEATMAFA